MLFLLDHPPSPCKGICQLDGQVCIGCGRQTGEIAEWPRASAARKQAIRDAAAGRLAILEPSLLPPKDSP